MGLTIEQMRRMSAKVAKEETTPEYKIDRTPLKDNEMRLLLRELNRMMTMTQSTIHRKLLTYHIGYVVYAAEAAKKYFEPKSFGGRSASDTEFGLDFIRPGMLGINTTGVGVAMGSTSTGVPVPDWAQTYSAPITAGNQGWNDWVSGEGGGTPYKMRQDSLIVVTSLDNLTQELYGTPPLATAVKPTLMNGETRPVITLRPMLIGDMPAMVLPSPWLLLPETDVRIEKQVRDVGKDCLAMYGIAFGTGNYLKKANIFQAD